MIGIPRENVNTFWQRPKRIIPFLIRKYNYATNDTTYNEDGVDIFEENWNNLVIPDVCRYNYFQPESELSGDTSFRFSRGAMGSEFIMGNFMSKKVHDTICVSANDFYPTLKDGINTEVYQHIDLPWGAVDNVTIHPEIVTKVTIEASDDNPNKRLIIHYLQPHQPYVGELGHSKLEFERNLKDSVRKSQMTKEDVRTVYIENLNIVPNEVVMLNESLDGKVVVTVDHSEMLGEKIGSFELHDHFQRVYRDELIKAPWYVLEYDPRRDIIAERPVSDMANLDNKELNQRLKDLEYKVQYVQ